jgi:secreted Zn-dependent insulinase-like peptidase
MPSLSSPFLPPGALDRFAQFFISPLFTDSATAREMQAVDSENNKNLQNDAWRLHQIHCASAKPGHPLGRFRCGSLKTLLGRSLARREGGRGGGREGGREGGGEGER